MKVICIKSKSFNYFNFSEKDFIKGQIYNALDGTYEFYLYDECYDRYMAFFDRNDFFEYFMLLSEYRNNKIDKILS